jgi:transcriptional regulator with XRE-family HTH domain
MCENFFKENIIYIRKCLDLTQREMAEKLDCPLKVYQSYEYGNGQPDLGRISCFSCTLNLTVDDLVKFKLAEHYTQIQLLQLSVKTNQNSKKTTNV